MENGVKHTTRRRWWRNEWVLSITAAALLATAAGCHRAAGGGSRSEASSADAVKKYPVRGVVQGVNAADGEVVLKHDAIPGLMEAMTMPYRLKDASVLSELHPGDMITGTIEAGHDAAGPTNMRLTDIVVVGQARPDYKPMRNYHVPAVGEAVPNFALLNQADRRITLDQFRGKALAITFIYTRCAMSDFCPRMSHNFAELDKRLAADPALYAKTHLLSVSFDPAYDTPKVLRSYGGAYTGRYTREDFSHWDFAAPPQAALDKMEEWFDVGVTGAGATLQHSVSTVVVGPDGKVAAYFPSNDWTPEQGFAAMKKAAGVS